MRDLPHHMKKLNRKIIRSALREEAEAETYETEFPGITPSKKEVRTLAKRQLRSERLSRTPIHDTVEERNQKMKHRVPIFDRNKAKPKTAKPTKKKTPRI